MPDLMPYLSQLSLQERPEIMVYGKQAHQNRDIAFYSDVSAGYKYSRQTIKSQPLDNSPDIGGISLMRWLLDTVNAGLGTTFNGILVNRYNTGEDYISAHSDDETALSKGMVAGISFGATRTFRIRDKESKKILLDLPHQSGMLVVMDGADFQKLYTHEIPVQKRIKEQRISVTFRHHLY
jgi:alkylated DNA repair dioxygenase AlkB